MNEDLLDFIEEQGLDVSLFIDAEGNPISQIREEMKANNKIFAFNSTPCQSNNHTTRSISGHCIECDTARIAFTLRHYNLGIVYIAGSIRGQAGRIWLNLELAKKPVHCIEYIVVHEMVHLLEKSHNKRFIALLDHYMPNWRMLKDELNRLPLNEY